MKLRHFIAADFGHVWPEKRCGKGRFRDSEMMIGHDMAYGRRYD